MKDKTQKKLASRIAEMTMVSGKIAVHSGCRLIYHQPAVPEKLKKIKK